MAEGRYGAVQPLEFPARPARVRLMENGHIYPSEYALRCEQRTDHPATHRALVDELRHRCPGEWPSLLGSVFAHREACMLAALRALDAALAEDKVTRPGLRRAMLAALAAISERGPEAVPPLDRS